MAQGAVNSLVGRLTALLIDEAHLLGGVRGDVEFIKEEMESMNSVLLHLTEAQHRAHHVRTWMKQVAGLARDCEAYVELHVQSIGSGVADPRTSKGLLGYLQRILRLLRTIPARHRIATRIRELKVRARDVGDRRLRYGVTVPSAADQESAILIDDVQASPEPGGKKDVGRCTLLEADGGLLDDDDQTRVNNGIDRLIEWLSEDAPAAAEGRPRVFSVLWKEKDYRPDLDEEDGDEREYESLDPEEREEIVSHDSNDDSGSGSESYSPPSWDDVQGESALAACIARGVYQHPSVVSSFGCKARSTVVTDNYGSIKPLGLLLREILEQVAPLPAEQEDTLRTTEAEELSTEKLAKKLQGYLKGKRFLIVLEDVRYRVAWDSISSALLHVGNDCPPGSAIIMTTSSREVAESSSPRKIFEAQSLYAAFRNKAEELIGASGYCSMEVIESILQCCHPDAFAMKMVLHLLYVNPNKTEDELMKIRENLSECERLNKSIAKQMLMFCYKELPSKYWSCLMYLSIFPKYHIIRRTSLARRWIAEGLITANLGTAMDRSMLQASATDEAERCFNALVTRGFILPWEISTACNIKSIRVHDEVREFITRIAADVSFAGTNLPPHLAHHLSIHSRIGLRATGSSHLVETDGDGNCIAAYLPYLAKSSQWQLLKVLDLEGCKGLKKKHLKNICKILLLKYLSLRNTDVIEIPKQFEKLQCLETLDIRQTALRALATKSFMLPMLKYLLAGQADSSSNSSICLPSGIRRMKNLEIMSHVEVSDNVDDLTDVGQLLQLRKLGVILHAKNGGLGLLFQQIEKLYDCLRSLSIRINHPVRSEGADAEEVVALVSPPKLLLENLNISGITSGLPLWIAELNQLVKITLSETDLEEDALGIIGNLRTLSCLRLRHKSYTRRELNFKKEEFKGLKSLVIEGSDITNITFDAGAAPKLEMIVWTFAKMEAISGVIHLPRLKKLELNGDCNPNPVRQAIKDHPNHPVFKHNPYHQGQEAETVIAASTP